MAQLTVDLSADKATLVKVAQFILQFAGYELPPTRVPAPVAPEVNPFGPEGKWNNGKGQNPTQQVVTHPLLTPPAEPEPVVVGVGAAVLLKQLEQDAAKVFGATDATHGGWIAPTPPAVIPPPPPPAGIDVDLRGLPWDPRIHASTRAKTAEGNWRQKRNVDPELMTKVEAELRQTMGAPVPLTPLAAGVGGNLTVSVPLPPIGVPPVPFAGSAVPPAPPISSTPPVPASAGAVPPASPGNAVSFPQLMQAITKAFTGGALNQQQIAAAVQKVGLASLPMLASRPDLVGAVASELGLAL